MSDIDFTADASLNEEIETPKRLELVDPVTEEPIIDEKGRPAFLMVYSAQSDTFQRRAFKIQGRVQTKLKRKGAGKREFDVEKDAEAQIYAAAFGDEWNIVRKEKGVWKSIDAPCTPENAIKWVLANPLYKPQIASMTDDIESFVNGEDANFTTEALSPSSKASKANSD